MGRNFRLNPSLFKLEGKHLNYSQARSWKIPSELMYQFLSNLIYEDTVEKRESAAILLELYHANGKDSGGEDFFKEAMVDRLLEDFPELLGAFELIRLEKKAEPLKTVKFIKVGDKRYELLPPEANKGRLVDGFLHYNHYMVQDLLMRIEVEIANELEEAAICNARKRQRPFYGPDKEAKDFYRATIGVEKVPCVCVVDNAGIASNVLIMRLSKIFDGSYTFLDKEGKEMLLNFI